MRPGSSAGKGKYSLRKPESCFMPKQRCCLKSAGRPRRKYGSARKPRPAPSGLGSSPRSSTPMATEWLVDFLKQHPEINFSIYEANTYDLIEKTPCQYSTYRDHSDTVCCGRPDRRAAEIGNDCRTRTSLLFSKQQPNRDSGRVVRPSDYSLPPLGKCHQGRI